MSDFAPKDSTFSVNPGQKRRYIAGEYNDKTRKPFYEIEVSIFDYVRHNVEINQCLYGKPGNCKWGWDIHNKASWPAFFLVKKDGIEVEKSSY